MRVLIADDHALMVDGLCSLLEAYGIEVAGTVGDGRAAVREALRLEPDLVLMDIRMPDCDGLTATRLIKAQRPEMKILILTTSAEDEDLFEAIKSGACGYLLKITSGPAFIEALHGLDQGIPPFSPGLAGRLLREFARLREAEAAARGGDAGRGRSLAVTRGMRQAVVTSPGGVAEGPHGPDPAEPDSPSPARLNERQTEVLRLVSAGLTYKEVGAKLALSEVTVRYHMSEIMHKLHLEHRSQVIAYAGRLGLQCPPENQ
jgi:DNA-binding NarL/FixJ family response regulator